MRTQCPDEEKIAEYIESSITEEERSQLEEHFLNCPLCLEEFMIANNLIRDRIHVKLNPVPPKTTEAAVRTIESINKISHIPWIETAMQSVRNLSRIVLNFLLFNLWTKWRLATVRSTKQIALKDLVCHKVEFKETSIEIEFEKTGESMAQIRVKLLDTNMAKKFLRVTLIKEDREVMSYLFDDNCVFLENIPFGQYTISLVGNDEELGKYHFRIKGNHYE